MKKLLAFILTIMALAVAANAQNAIVAANDLRTLLGAKWVGELTYRDYQSGKSVSIKSHLMTTLVDKKGLEWEFAFEYPLEPKANRKSLVILTSDGKTFDDETVIERALLPDKTLRIVTTARGEDSHKPATFRHIYLIGMASFTIKKEVKFDEGTEFFERNIYSWKR